MGEITKCHLRSTMVDEISNSSTFQQCIAFVRCVVKDKIKISFLDTVFAQLMQALSRAIHWQC